MPGSDELFHDGQPIAPSIFKTLKPDTVRAGMLAGEPTPEDMTKQFEAALHNKHVNLKEVNIKVFDLSVGSHVEEYCELYRDLYVRVQRHEVVVRGVERKFVETPSPRWLIYIEWWVYALEVDGKEVTPEEWEDIKRKDSPLEREPAEQPVAQGD
jgi:hypothetical protein